MSIYTLWNLQHGISNSKYQHETNNSADSLTESYVLAKIGIKERTRLIIDEQRQEEYENQAARNFADKLKREIESTFK